MTGVKKIGMLFAVISAICWGTYGTFYSLLLKGGLTDFSLVALAPLALFFYFGIRVFTTKAKVLKEIPWRYYLFMAIQGFIIVNAMNYSYFRAYSYGMPVGIVSTVAFANVFIIMIESYFIFKYRFTTEKIISMIGALVGISFILNIFSGFCESFSLIGILWTLLIPLFFGTNVTLNSYFIVKRVDSDAILFITQGFALLFILLFQVSPIDLMENITAAVRHDTSILFEILGFCAIPQIISYAAMQECLKRIEPAVMGIVYSLDPVTALILGITVFSQSIGLLQLIGIILVLSAVIYINYAEGKGAAID